MRAARIFFWLGLFVAGMFLLLQAPVPAAPAPATGVDPVYILTLNDEIITPVTAEYITHGIDEADAHGAHAVVIQLDTPGGLLSSTHTIVKAILNAPLPVVVYVAPAGARAGSAGVFITLSAHVAAMEPTTHIGAAHPVDENGNWPVKPQGKSDNEQNASEDDNAPPPDIMSEKILNDTVAFMRTIAHARDRNETWAVRAITHSESITAEEAHANGVVDILASGMTSLLKEVDGRSVKVGEKTVVIDCDEPQLIPYEFSSREQFLNLLANPVLAYILMMVAFYGIIFEITHPGIGISGTIGGIALILALLGMQAMSINMAGLGLIMLGLALFIVEIFTAGFGAFLAGGVICVVLGTIMLYQTNEPFLQESIPYILAIALAACTLLGFILWKVVSTHKAKPLSPLEKLVGEKGRVSLAIKNNAQDHISKGKVKVFGEVWDAVADTELETDTEIKVVAVDPANPRVLHVAKLQHIQE